MEERQKRKREQKFNETSEKTKRVKKFAKPLNEQQIEAAKEQLKLGVKCEEKQSFLQAFVHYLEAAKNGFHPALTRVGICYEEGIGVTKDFTEAVKHYKKAGQRGNENPLARYRFGKCLEDGRGVPRDLEKAMRAYRGAAKLGYAPAKYELGEHHDNLADTMDKKDVQQRKKHENEALKYYREAAEQGEDRALTRFGAIYEEGDFGDIEKSDEKQAFQYYDEAAKKGNLDAMSHFARCYKDGIGIEKDIKKAIKEYKKAVKLGSASAAYELGEYYDDLSQAEDDHAVYKKYENRALKYYQQAAAKGEARALNCLGVIYQEGNFADIDESDDEQGFQYYKRAAEEENIDAMMNVAYCYKKGKGVVQDLDLAITWYKLALRGGCQFSLIDGPMIACGNDYRNKAQFDKAKDLYLYLATQQRCRKAEYHLGLMYELGEGVDRDIKQAVCYYKLAADQGYIPAYHNLGSLYQRNMVIDPELEGESNKAARLKKAEACFTKAIDTITYDKNEVAVRDKAKESLKQLHAENPDIFPAGGKNKQEAKQATTKSPESLRRSSSPSGRGFWRGPETIAESVAPQPPSAASPSSPTTGLIPGPGNPLGRK